jgi:addiction module HigA family antidote
MSNKTQQIKNQLKTESMRPIHPGEVLQEEFLTPYQLTAHALSMALQVPAPRINDIVREKRAITVDTALRLAKFFGNSAEFWIGLQTDYDMAIARASLDDVLSKIERRDNRETA